MKVYASMGDGIFTKKMLVHTRKTAEKALTSFYDINLRMIIN